MDRCGKMKLLIAEDEQNLALVLQRALTRRGHDVTVVHDGDAGLRALSTNEFDVALLDITMPGPSGLDLCRFVSRNKPDTVVMIVSAMTDIEFAVEALRFGAFDYVTKPFKMADIDEALQRATAHRASKLAIRQYGRQLHELVRESTIRLTAAKTNLAETLMKVDLNDTATLKALSTALRARGIDNRSGGERLMAISSRVGRELAIADADIRALEQASLVHDIGNIGVPDAILRKNGPLTQHEWVEVRRHVHYAVQIINSLPFLERATPIVAQHHEQYDGKGYPNGLAGNQICLAARVFALADAVDAIMSDRPHRRARSLEAAVEEVIRGKGTQFDPIVIDAFLKVPFCEWQMLKDSEEPAAAASA